MAYDEALVDRMRAALLRRKGVTEKKMFGGVCFMVDNHMCCGVAGKDLALRLARRARLQRSKSHTRPFDMTGKAMKTMLFVSARRA